MRLWSRAAAAAAVASVAVGALAMSAAMGGFTASYHLTASPDHGVPGASITLSGTPGPDFPGCSDAEVIIRGTYTTTADQASGSGASGVQTVNTQTGGDGNFSVGTQIPADAAPGGTITYMAEIPECPEEDFTPVGSDTAAVTVDQPVTTTTSTTSSTTTSTTTPTTTTSIPDTGSTTTTSTSTTSTTAPSSVLGTQEQPPAAPPATPVAASPTFTG